MEAELRNMINLMIIVCASLTYCHFVSSRISKGLIRLLFFLPIISTFGLLPFLLSFVLPRLSIALAISWYANFKLLLVALSHEDPLPADPSVSLLDFIILISLPVKINENTSTHAQKRKINLTFSVTFVMNVVIWSFMLQLDGKKNQYPLLVNPKVNQLVYFLRIIYYEQVAMDLFVAIAKLSLKHEVDLNFDNPVLSSSLQNFWGKRWNLPASSLLKSIIYIPIRSLFAPIVGRRWAIHPAILATFTTSGLMHEVVYSYVGLGWPTWEVTWFFVVNGVCVAIEIEVKKEASKNGWSLHRTVSTPLTMGFVGVTGTWLCCKELMRCSADVREMDEFNAFVDYMKLAFFAANLFSKDGKLTRGLYQ